MTKYLVTQTRTIVIKSKSYKFVKGQVKTALQVERIYGIGTTPPSWLAPLKSGFEGIKEKNNSDVDMWNANPSEYTDKEIADNAKVAAHLETCGLTRDEYCFVKGASDMGSTDKETVWVGVKMNNPDDKFVRDNGQPVTLQRQNFISTHTFLNRVKKGEALFLHTQF